MAKIKFTVPGVLASITGGNREIDADASTVGDAVSFLVSKLLNNSVGKHLTTLLSLQQAVHFFVR